MTETFISDLFAWPFSNAAHNFLTGSIPVKFSDLTELKEMDIRNCSLIGLLPPELSYLGEHMEYLRLSNNGISGPIPSSFGALTNLLALDLGKSLFAGTIEQRTIHH